jgi:hypothetical protein
MHESEAPVCTTYPALVGKDKELADPRAFEYAEGRARYSSESVSALEMG